MSLIQNLKRGDLVLIPAVPKSTNGIPIEECDVIKEAQQWGFNYLEVHFVGKGWASLRTPKIRSLSNNTFNTEDLIPIKTPEINKLEFNAIDVREFIQKSISASVNNRYVHVIYNNQRGLIPNQRYIGPIKSLHFEYSDPKTICVQRHNPYSGSYIVSITAHNTIYLSIL